jgi:hypothetical protein
MSQVSVKRNFPNIGSLPIIILVLAIATAVIHLYLGIQMGSMMGHMPGPAGGAGGAPAPPAGTPGAGGPPSGDRPGGSSLMGMLPLPLPILFDLNFVGYIVLAGALYLPRLQRFQPIIRWVLIGYTALTIILWYLISGGHANMFAYVDKVVEVALIVLLLIDGWQSRSRKA